MELPKQKYIGLAALAKKWDMEVEDVLNLAVEKKNVPLKYHFIRFQYSLHRFKFIRKKYLRSHRHVYPLNLYWQDSTMFRPHIRIRPAHIARLGLDSGEYYLEVNETKYPELLRTWDKPANPSFKLPIKAIKILRLEIEAIDAEKLELSKEQQQTSETISEDDEKYVFLLPMPKRDRVWNTCCRIALNDYFFENDAWPDVETMIRRLRESPPDGYTVKIEGEIATCNSRVKTKGKLKRQISDLLSEVKRNI